MKATALIVVFFTFSLCLAAVDIQSTPAGGNWTASSTWIGNQVPGAADNVTINGLVLVNNHVTVASLTIASTGSLMNAPGLNWSATVNGIFTNYGSCENNPGSGTFLLYLYSSLYDYGVLSNGWVYLNNTAEANLFHAAEAGPITCANWLSSSTSGNYRLLSDIRFENTQVDFNSHTVYMFQGTDTYDISLNGGRLYRAVLDTAGFSTLALGNGAYLYNVAAEDIILQGAVLYYLELSFQNLNVAVSCTVNTWSA